MSPKAASCAAGISAVLLVAVLSVGWLVTALSQQPPPHNGNRPSQAEQRNTGVREQIGEVMTLTIPPGSTIRIVNGASHGDETAENGHWYDTFRDHPAEWLLAVFNGLLVLFTWKLFTSTADLVRTHDEISERELRAHFFAMVAEIGDPRDFLANTVPPRIVASIDLRNTGRTPAYEVQMFGCMCVRPYTPDTDPKSLVLLPLAYPESGIARGIFGPGLGRRKTEYLADENNRPRGTRQPTGQERQGIFDNLQTVFVYGEIQYRDEFRARRWTTYCFIWNRDVELGRDREMATFQAWNQAGIQDKDPKPPFCENSKWLAG